MYSVRSLNLSTTQYGMIKDGEDGEPEILKDVRASIRESVLSSFRSSCGRSGRQAVELLRVWPDSCSAMELRLAIHDPLPVIVGLITYSSCLSRPLRERRRGDSGPMRAAHGRSHRASKGGRESVRVSLRNPREDWPKIFFPSSRRRGPEARGLGCGSYITL